MSLLEEQPNTYLIKIDDRDWYEVTEQNQLKYDSGAFSQKYCQTMYATRQDDGVMRVLNDEDDIFIGCRYSIVA